MSAPTLRRFRASDLPAVLSLHRRALEPLGAYKGDGPWDDDLRDVEGHYFPDGEFLVAEQDGALAAMGAIRRLDAETAEVKRMRTEPALQGRGLGKIVLARLEARARELGYRRLILEASKRQGRAFRFYARCGYVPVRDEVIDGLDSTWFEKRLVADPSTAGLMD